jgi:hypothetical protein
MGIAETIKSNKSLKKFVHFLLIPRGQARPRLWVKYFVNPFYHKRGKNSVITDKVVSLLYKVSLTLEGRTASIECKGDIRELL